MLRAFRQWMRWLFMIAVIVSVIFSCSHGDRSVVVLPLQDRESSQRDDPASLSTGSPQTITNVLIESTLLHSQTRPVNPEHYWIAWKDPSLGYIATSKSGVPVIVPNYPPTSGSSLLGSSRSVSLVEGGSASPQVFTPFGDLALSSDDSCSLECSSVQIKELNLPPTTNEGIPEDLIIQAIPYDAQGNPLADRSGVHIEITPDSKGRVEQPLGVTDTAGYYQTIATLLLNLKTTTFEIQASCGLSTANRNASMTDPCHTGDPLEKPHCPPPSPSPSPPPPCSDCSGAAIFGDPHIFTFDDLYYKFQAVGEFTLVRSLDSSLLVQARLLPANSSYTSAVAAIAAHVNGDRVAFYGQGSPLWLNGSPITPPQSSGSPLALPNGGILQALAANTYRLTWPNGAYLVVNGFSHGFINGGIRVPRALSLQGLLGTSPNDIPQDDLQSATGESFSIPISFEQLYQNYGNSWRITQEESLFDYSPGQNTATFTDLNHPTQQVSVELLTPEQNAQATQICQAAGLSDPLLLETCILDVGVTGDAGYAETTAETQARAPAGVEELEVYPGLLTNPAPAAQATSFGFSVSLSGDHLLIGAHRQQTVYLYTTDSDIPIQIFTDPSTNYHIGYGYVVFLSGERALISDIFARYPEAVGNGAVYLYDTISGDLLQSFINPSLYPGNEFGSSVSMSGERVLIGNRYASLEGMSNAGAAYLYDTSGTFLHTFTHPARAGTYYGHAVSISGDRILIGGRSTDEAYLYDTNSGELLRRFTDPDPSLNNTFGFSVAISGDRALIGARGSSHPRVYLYEIESGALLQELIPPSAGEDYGYSVAISGERILIGSDPSTYLYDANTGELLQSYSDPSGTSTEFGDSVSLSDKWVLSGAYKAEGGGVAYLHPVP